MPRKNRALKSAPLRVQTVTLTAADVERLGELAGEVADRTGRPASRSCILRALLRCYRQEQLPEVVQEVEKEIHAGRLWGSRPGHGRGGRPRKQPEAVAEVSR